MAVRLNINVRNPTSVLASYDVIRVRRSVTGESGVYSLITAPAPAAATLLAPTSQLYDVGGKTLSLLRDSHAQADILFNGINPLTAAQVADQINAEIGVDIAEDESGALRLSSSITGTASKIEIVDSSAVASFGWVGGDRDIGEDPHITILGDQTLYEYVDNDGADNYWYRVSYLNLSNGQVSAESTPFLGTAATLVDPSNLSVAKVDLVDASGVAVPDQDITFYGVHEPYMVDGLQIALTRAPITITTDNAGHAETPLVRGIRVKVVFEGTNLIREITVPDQSTFDLLTVLATATDPFSVSEPPFPFALRRTV